MLRRPPLGHVLATAHDMAREHRIIARSARTSVPGAARRSVCAPTTAVNGAPFYVMSFVDGVVLDSADKAERMPHELRRQASFHLIDVLADLHAIDIDAVGLGDFAKREGYVERQVKRWSTQWENSKTRELPAIDEVATTLRERMPEQHGVSIAHGDYRFGNCLTDVGAGRIAAVLDWELCTLGDPLADVGYLGVYWFDGNAETVRANDPTSAGGFPTLRRAARAVRDARPAATSRGIDYYVAFRCWRLAVISEGVYARYLHGAMGEQDFDFEMFKGNVEQLAERALDAVRRCRELVAHRRAARAGSAPRSRRPASRTTTFRRGSGPGVIVVHEIPGITPKVAQFANDVVAAGFTVVMPSLVGTPGKEPNALYGIAVDGDGVHVARVHALGAERDVAGHRMAARARQGGARRARRSRVGAIGMCFSGGFALAMMVDDVMVAPVLVAAVAAVRGRACSAARTSTSRPTTHWSSPQRAADGLSGARPAVHRRQARRHPVRSSCASCSATRSSPSSCRATRRRTTLCSPSSATRQRAAGPRTSSARSCSDRGRPVRTR